MAFSLHGIAVSRGVAIGRAQVLRGSALDVAHYVLPKSEIENEVARLTQAIAATRTELQGLWKTLPSHAPAEAAAFIDVHVMILEDPMLSIAPLDLIRERRYNAEWALTTQLSELSEQFARMEDEYLSQRAHDVRQVVERVLSKLAGHNTRAYELETRVQAGETAALIEEPLIIVAHDISPADMLQFKTTSFAGFVTDLGAQNSHTAIVARSLAIPAVVGVPDASRLIRQNDVLIIDGVAGVVIIDPSPQILREYQIKQSEQEIARKQLQSITTQAAITRDGSLIQLMANIEVPADCTEARSVGAQGVGLYRSEFLFLNRNGELPGEDEQFEAYATVARAMHGMPVVIRTLDVGADKPIDAQVETALNPALGLRAIRYCLAEPQLFLTQLRALLRASAVGDVRILVPMLAHAHEIRQTLHLLAQAKQQLRDAQIVFDENIKIGAMIEIPAAALTLPLFVKYFDFLSIGTNDLIQYTLAIDRVDHEVAHLYEPLHPAVLRLLADTISIGHAANVEVAVCGEMAGDVAFTALLLGLGLNEFSMQPGQILAVKQRVLQSNLQDLKIVAQQALQCEDANQVKALLEKLE